MKQVPCHCEDTWDGGKFLGRLLEKVCEDTDLGCEISCAISLKKQKLNISRCYYATSSLLDDKLHQLVDGWGTYGNYENLAGDTTFS